MHGNFNLFRYNSWHIGNHWLNPDNIELSLKSLTSFMYNTIPESLLTPSTYVDFLLSCNLVLTFQNIINPFQQQL
jgi:hypothetical protein